jgi:hypothetical protein
MVVLSSCTNYDDQFDDLNSQLSTLKTQIDGFTAVSSGVTALQGTVSSLQAAVALLPKTSTPATDISGLQASLTALAATVAELKTSLAGAATSAEVATLAANLAAAQTDLSELLASNNVYSDNLVINSVATLEFAKNLGDKLTIVNANVTFDVDATMNITDVQAVANKFVTIVKDLNYYATSSTVAAITFDNLTSAGDVAIAQAGNYVLPKLANATDIYLGDNYSSKVGIVDLRGLAKVSSLNTSTILAADVAGTNPATNTVNTVSFSQATEIHLTSVPYYGAGLTILAKDGSVVDLTAFASVNADGDEVATDLLITGPAAVSLGDTYTLGTFSATDVVSVTLGAHRGNVILNGVTNFTHANLVGTLAVTGSNDLTSVNITGDFDDVTTGSKDKSGPAINLASQTALKTATIAGTVGVVTLTGATNLQTLSVNGTVDSVVLTNNNDLVSVTTAGTIGSFSIDGADDLASLSLGHASLTRATGATGTNLTAILAGSLVVTNNPKLASLVSKADALSTLTVTVNSLLSSIDFTGLKVVGGADAHNVAVSGNDLNAEKIVEGDGTTAGATAKVGAFTSASGMSTLKTYLDDAVAEAKATISVSFDSADTHILKSTTTGGTDTETNSITSGALLVVMNITPNVADTTPTVRETKSSVAMIATDGLGNNNAIVLSEGITVSSAALGATATIVGTSAITTVDALITAINANTTFGSNLTITAAQDAYVRSYNKISLTNAGGSASNVASAGSIFWSYGSTVTGTVTVATGATMASVAAAIASSFTTTNGYSAEANTVSGTLIVSKLVSNTTNSASSVINIGNNVTFGNTLAFNVASSTALFSANASNTAGASVDYFLSVAKSTIKGLRVTVKNNSTTTATDAVISITGSGSTISSLSVLGSDVNFESSTALVAGFGDISTTGAGTPGASTDRTSWL